MMSNEKGLRIGVLGGTFDPIHIAHLIIAEEARALLPLDRVIFVPALRSPLKWERTFFSAEQRLHMVHLAIADNPYFSVSRVDIDREGPSYTVDTLEALRAAYGPQTQLFFILGMDAFRYLDKWYRPERIIQLAHLAVLGRPGYGVDMRRMEKAIPGISRVTHFIDGLQLNISSTDIRRRLIQGLPIKYQVPATVEAYIRQILSPGQSLPND